MACECSERLWRQKKCKKFEDCEGKDSGVDGGEKGRV